MDAADRGRLVQLAYRFVWNRADAEDAVHNALAIAHEKGGQLREGGRWWSWVARIVVRQCLLLRRSEGRRARRERIVGGERASSDVAETIGMERRERAAAIRRALEQLPPRQRAAVVLAILVGSQVESFLRRSPRENRDSLVQPPVVSVFTPVVTLSEESAARTWVPVTRCWCAGATQGNNPIPMCPRERKTGVRRRSRPGSGRGRRRTTRSACSDWSTRDPTPSPT